MGVFGRRWKVKDSSKMRRPKGYIMSEIQKENISNGNKGKIRTDEHKKNYSINNCRFWLGKQLCNKHKLNISKALRGPGWKERNRHDWMEYRQWQKEIYAKDNYTCQKCLKRGGKLNAHHIENFINEQLRFEVSNGIVFCKKCYIEFHHIYGRKNNTLEQVLQFIR